VPTRDRDEAEVLKIYEKAPTGGAGNEAANLSRRHPQRHGALRAEGEWAMVPARTIANDSGLMCAGRQRGAVQPPSRKEVGAAADKLGKSAYLSGTPFADPPVNQTGGGRIGAA